VKSNDRLSEEGAAIQNLRANGVEKMVGKNATCYGRNPPARMIE